MSARQQRNVQYLLVGDTAALTSGKPNTLGAGEIGIFDAAGLRVTSANVTAGMKFFLAQGGTSPLKRTPLIDGSKLKKVTAKAWSTSRQQQDILGYNGVSGAIDVITNNLYMVDIYVEDYLVSSHDGRYIKHFQYESNATSTQADIALGLAASGTYNWSREAKDANGDPFMTFRAISAEAGAASTVAVDVVKGSKVVEYAAAPTVAAGDFVRLGTGVKDAVYKVISVSTNTVTLDRPVGEATQTFAIAATEEITAAAGNAGDWGVAMEGTPKTHVIGREFFGVVRWSTILGGDGFGTTPLTNDKLPTEGLGEVNSVKDLEWFCNGNNGEFFRMGEPTIHPFTTTVNDSVAGNGYDYLDISFEDITVGSFVPNHSPIRVTLATPGNPPAYMTTANDGLRDVLEVIAGLTAGDLDV